LHPLFFAMSISPIPFLRTTLSPGSPPFHPQSSSIASSGLRSSRHFYSRAFASSIGSPSLFTIRIASVPRWCLRLLAHVVYSLSRCCLFFVLWAGADPSVVSFLILSGYRLAPFLFEILPPLSASEQTLHPPIYSVLYSRKQFLAGCLFLFSHPLAFGLDPLSHYLPPLIQLLSRCDFVPLYMPPHICLTESAHASPLPDPSSYPCFAPLSCLFSKGVMTTALFPIDSSLLFFLTHSE